MVTSFLRHRILNNCGPSHASHPVYLMSLIGFPRAGIHNPLTSSSTPGPLHHKTKLTFFSPSLRRSHLEGIIRKRPDILSGGILKNGRVRDVLIANRARRLPYFAAFLMPLNASDNRLCRTRQKGFSRTTPRRRPPHNALQLHAKP
jgi:hypothetical protein